MMTKDNKRIALTRAELVHVLLRYTCDIKSEAVENFLDGVLHGAEGGQVLDAEKSAERRIE